MAKQVTLFSVFKKMVNKRVLQTLVRAKLSLCGDASSAS